MSWTTCPEADEFFRIWQKDLEKDESIHCLAWAAIARSSDTTNTPRPFHFFTHHDTSGHSAYAIFFAQKKELILSKMSPNQAAKLLFFLDPRPLQIEELEGPVDPVMAFAQCWIQAPQRSYKMKMHQALHELREVQPPDFAGGTLCLATRDHEDTVHTSLRGFVTDCFPSDNWTDAQITARAERLITEKNGYLWQDEHGRFVSMAAIVRESPNTASISLVYTPPENRRRGHAARVVAALSQAQLDVGKTACNLHTDLSNPTSNSVYHRIGYRVIAHLQRLSLTRTEGS